MSKLAFDKKTTVSTDPRLESAVRYWLLSGLTVVLLLPAARGQSDWLGWLPLWLVGMPAAALWSLHRFRLPVIKASARHDSSRSLRRRRPGMQARRRLAPAAKRVSQAA